jgi:hypothetical protein
MRRSLSLLVLPLVLATGCNLGDLTSTSEVIRTRVAGIRAAPSEIGMGESTTLSALLVHPPEGPPDLGAIWFACVEAGDARGCLGFDLSSLGGADDDDSAGGFDPTELQFGIGDSFVYTAAGPDLEAAWAELDPDDRVEGLSILVSVTYVNRPEAELEGMFLELAVAQQSGDTDRLTEIREELGGLVEEGIPAARRIVVSDKSLGVPSAIDCPAEALAPNTNPELLGVTLHFEPEGRDSGFDLGEVTFVAPGASLVLRPRATMGVAEDYLYINTDLVTECRQEAPWYAWLTNGADASRNYTFTADADDLDELPGRPKINTIVLPEREDFPDVLTLWLVVRDRRGGLDWQELKFIALDE